MKPAVHAELREAAARGIVPPRWIPAGESSSVPPPCAADRHHHWSEAPADDAMDIKYGIQYVWECSACRMRRIELHAGGSGSGSGSNNNNGSSSGGVVRTAYAPSVEYVLWHVSCRAHGYARDAERGHAAAAAARGGRQN